MKRLLKLTFGLLVVYLIIRLLTEYLRLVRVMLDEPVSLPPQRLEPESLLPSPPPPLSKMPARLDLNQADAVALATLPGIGPALAERIVAYRQQSGPFVTLDDLSLVRGVGPALVERLGALVTLSRL